MSTSRLTDRVFPNFRNKTDPSRSQDFFSTGRKDSKPYKYYNLLDENVIAKSPNQLYECPMWKQIQKMCASKMVQMQGAHMKTPESSEKNWKQFWRDWKHVGNFEDVNLFLMDYYTWWFLL